MLSDEDKDVDVESDDGDDLDTKQSTSRISTGNQYYSQADKRAHHNALERKRRDHIKDSFNSLRESVPTLEGEKVASRAQILKKAADYILFMRDKNSIHQQDIHDLKRQNSLLEAQIRTLERAKKTGIFDTELNKCMFETDTESSEEEEVKVPAKKVRKLRSVKARRLRNGRRAANVYEK